MSDESDPNSHISSKASATPAAHTYVLDNHAADLPRAVVDTRDPMSNRVAGRALVGGSSVVQREDTPSSLNIIPISAGADDRWRLTDPYVEEVWSEFLGPTATMLARRLGRVMESRPGGAEVDVPDLSDSLGVGRGVAIRALERLHRFEVVHSDLSRRIIGVSGYAPSVGEGRLFRLSAAGRAAHDRLTAGAVAEPPVGRATAILTARAQPLEGRGVLPIGVK